MKTKAKIIKKSVDSIKKRKNRRGFVLDINKISNRQFRFEAICFKSETKKIILSDNSRFGCLKFLKEPITLSLLQDNAMKLAAIFLIINLSWLGIFRIGRTAAFFNDIEISEGNTFSAGTLDFSLSSPTDDFAPQDECNESENEDNDNSMQGNNNHNDRPDDCDNDSGRDDDDDSNNENGNNKDKGNKQNDQEDNDHDEDEDDGGNTFSLTREIQIKQEGSMSFQYSPSTTDIAGDSDFCDALTLNAELAGEIVYSGNIADFNFENSPFAIGEEDKNIWNFIVSFSVNNGEENQEDGEGDKSHNGGDSGDIKLCQFNFLFRARQIDLGPEYGFGAEKEIRNTIKFNSGDGSDEDEGEEEPEEEPEEDNQDEEEPPDFTGGLEIETSLTANGSGDGNAEAEISAGDSATEESDGSAAEAAQEEFAGEDPSEPATED